MGKTIQGGERTLILKVLSYFENEKKQNTNLLPFDQAIMRTCMATGISKSTLMKIKNEAKKVQASMASTSGNLKEEVKSEDEQSQQLDTSAQALAQVKLETPGKKRKKYKKKIDLSEDQLQMIKNIVDNFYAVEKETPTLRKVLKVVKRDLNFPGQRDSLRSILKTKFGFKFSEIKKKDPKKEKDGKDKKDRKERSTNSTNSHSHNIAIPNEYEPLPSHNIRYFQQQPPPPPPPSQTMFSSIPLHHSQSPQMYCNVSTTKYDMMTHLHKI